MGFFPRRYDVIYNFAIEDYVVPENPHFLWVTEFPLFTRDDVDKDILAKGRWSSSHHPFTAPMWEDIEAMYNGQIDTVRILILSATRRHPVTFLIGSRAAL